LADLVVRDGEGAGAEGFDVATSEPISIRANAVVLCSDGMMKMFRRNRPNNNAGDGVGIAKQADGATFNR
jgi:succinate dehydrogenase/fumarate reductase flavoprotein subunit